MLDERSLIQRHPSPSRPSSRRRSRSSERLLIDSPLAPPALKSPSSTNASPGATDSSFRRRPDSTFRRRRLSRSLASHPLASATGEVPGSTPEIQPAAQPARGAGADQVDKADDAPSAAPASGTRPRQESADSFYKSAEMGVDIEITPGSPMLQMTGFVHSFSCHGCEPAADGSGRVDKINQDCAGMAYPFAGRGDTALFCVMDGHGDSGHDVSLMVLNAMHEALDASGQALLQKPPAALAQAFQQVQGKLREESSKTEVKTDATESGACANVVLMRRSTLWVANVGDCRCVLGTKREGVLSAVALSTDHKPDLPTEAARIMEAGGFVKPAMGEGEDFSPARLFANPAKPWLGPGLAMSRSMGDLNGECCGLTSIPEASSRALKRRLRALPPMCVPQSHIC